MFGKKIALLAGLSLALSVSALVAESVSFTLNEASDYNGPIVELNINGTLIKAGIDTASSQSLAYRSLFEKLGLADKLIVSDRDKEIINKLKEDDIARNLPNTILDEQKIKPWFTFSLSYILIGSKQFNKVGLSYFDGIINKLSIDCLIGMDVLAQCKTMKVDYGNRVISFDETVSGPLIPFADIDYRLFVIPIRVGEARVMALLDTGMQWSMLLNQACRVTPTTEKVHKSLKMAVEEGDLDVRVVALYDVQIGEKALAGISAVEVLKGSESLDTLNTVRGFSDLILGGDFFQRNVVVFDFEHNGCMVY